MFEGIRRWEVLFELMQEHGGRTVAEVGCKEGRTTEYLLSAFEDSFVYAIDPFENIANEGESYADWDFDEIRADFLRRTKDYRGRYQLLEMTSLAAASCVIADKSLDLVFIDAAHDYENVHADIEAWYPKVKPRGFICGHDWNHKWPGVQRAVADHFNLMHVQTFPDSVWGLQV